MKLRSRSHHRRSQSQSHNHRLTAQTSPPPAKQVGQLSPIPASPNGDHGCSKSAQTKAMIMQGIKGSSVFDIDNAVIWYWPGSYFELDGNWAIPVTTVNLQDTIRDDKGEHPICFCGYVMKLQLIDKSQKESLNGTFAYICRMNGGCGYWNDTLKRYQSKLKFGIYTMDDQRHMTIVPYLSPISVLSAPTTTVLDAALGTNEAEDTSDSDGSDIQQKGVALLSFLKGKEKEVSRPFFFSNLAITEKNTTTTGAAKHSAVVLKTKAFKYPLI
ncbi:hypothetical protein C8R41DRAFT_866371 [Lentinula lateritia]|uniref:Uncharacterized protein n=1 Tax=Lentinula lateritia TaxID=40482 RepID=A0ABQ8VIV3_9AGAR|nr:hypothetical protein C8R41DRAFT_866371 [Lentinula lateritia]